MKKPEIREFLNDYCDRTDEMDMPDHMWELLMDDHRCIVWHGVEYIMPENCSMWTNFEQGVADHLYDNHAL
jgi:hypothetical protein